MNPTNRDYSEKRNYIRMKIGSPLECSVTHSEQSSQGLCLDLSGGGMLIELESEIPTGCRVEVSVASEHGHGPALFALAEIARVEAASNGKFTYGLRILEMKN